MLTYSRRLRFISEFEVQIEGDTLPGYVSSPSKKPATFVPPFVRLFTAAQMQKAVEENVELLRESALVVKMLNVEHEKESASVRAFWKAIHDLKNQAEKARKLQAQLMANPKSRRVAREEVAAEIASCEAGVKTKHEGRVDAKKKRDLAYQDGMLFER